MSTNKYFITTRKIPTYIKYLISKKGGQTVHEVTSTTGIFYTDMIAPLKRLLVSFEPIQSGSGTPSPTNVRPISGYDSVDVIVSSTASDGNTYTTALGRTVYGGTVDLVSGVMTVDRAGIMLTESLPWGSYSLIPEGDRYRTYVTVTGKISETVGTYKPLCDKLTPVANSYPPAYGVSINSVGNLLVCMPITIATKQDFLAWIAEQRPFVVYPIAEPQTYQLTPQQINTLKGTNVVTIANGNLVELVYLTHTFKEELHNQYKLLEYIESSGTQYIDTLINGEANWIAKFQGVSTTRTRSACLVTNEDGGDAGKGKWLGYNSSGKWGTSGNNFTTINYNEQVDINAEFKSAGTTVTINGVELVHSTKLIFTNETWKLLSGSTSCPSSVRCYKASCYKENVLVGNFIPALRISDNKPGMYDTVTETFFVNQGTGEFSY